MLLGDQVGCYYAPLTTNEIAEAKKAYGDKIKDYGAVRVYRKKWAFFQGEHVAMTPNGPNASVT